jgi:hypothetical protein
MNMAEFLPLRRCLAIDAFVGLIYLVVVLLLVTVEVAFEMQEFGRIPLLGASIALCLYVGVLHVRTNLNLFLSLLLAFFVICLTFIVALTVGVNFMFMIGGSL